jgi:hypothetical protein
VEKKCQSFLHDITKMDVKLPIITNSNTEWGTHRPTLEKQAKNIKADAAVTTTQAVVARILKKDYVQNRGFNFHRVNTT